MNARSGVPYLPKRDAGVRASMPDER